MTPSPRRIELPELGISGDRDAARVLAQNGDVVAVVVEPASRTDRETLREAAIRAALEEDLGKVVLAGIAFAPLWGGDAVGFT